MFKPTAALLAAALACGACGGTIDASTQDGEGASSAPAPAPGPNVQAPAQDDAAADAGDAKARMFVCRIALAATSVDLGCGTLSDGGASYYDTSANTDCRVYAQGAGQGCAPDMDCHAWIDIPAASGAPSGVLSLVQGTCVDPSK